MFSDRRHAGVLLGAEVVGLNPPEPVVYALPRGGMPVAYEVAQALSCPLDVLVVRKVGVPFQPELAMGAIAEGGVTIRNEEIIGLIGIDPAEFAAVAERERQEMERRVQAYRSGMEAITPAGHTAIVVDDGLATGSTALAAVEVLKRKGAVQVWVAAPVAPRGGLGKVEEAAERLVVLTRPRDFAAVGVWYDDFTQTSDEEVASLLADSRLA